MSDLKLFRIGPAGVAQLEGRSVALEKSLQNLMEKNLEALLGVRFLASEYSTGKKHGGRIDQLVVWTKVDPERAKTLLVRSYEAN